MFLFPLVEYLLYVSPQAHGLSFLKFLGTLIRNEYHLKGWSLNPIKLWLVTPITFAPPEGVDDTLEAVFSRHMQIHKVCGSMNKICAWSTQTKYSH